MQDAPSDIGDLNISGIHRAWYALGYSIEMASLRYSEDGGGTTDSWCLLQLYVARTVPAT